MENYLKFVLALNIFGCVMSVVFMLSAASRGDWLGWIIDAVCFVVWAKRLVELLK
jgi:hypothetical protein